MAKKTTARNAAEFPTSFETFQRISKWSLSNLTTSEPFCFNGEVGVRKYRVTIEVVEESAEVLAERVRKLWRECDNAHHYGPLRAAAESLGVELDSRECGIDEKRR